MYTNHDRFGVEAEREAISQLDRGLQQWEGQPITRVKDVADRLWELDSQILELHPYESVEEGTALQMALWIVTEEVTCYETGAEYPLDEQERQIVSWAGRHLSSGNPVYVRLAEVMAGWIRTLP